MTAPPACAHQNRLAGQSSPYLLQHAHNPVDWWPWGAPALAEAKRTGKPILLSVGYAACHWCHVMAHESFEDPEVAAVMNELFVNIKVDREERPDIDQIYMSALHLLGEQGGWPLTMFLTPDGEPVWGGTYFPKTARYGRPGFLELLRAVAQLFAEQPERIEQNRRALMAALRSPAQAEASGRLGRDDLDQLASRLAEAFDPVNGGLRGAPKFPQAAMLELLWRAGLRTGQPQFFERVEHTLERICRGGIYDHLGGGFSRYAVDARWLVPHFEKMLYDNAQLLELLALAFARSQRPVFRDCALATVDWLCREMAVAGGGFGASLDADSEGEEGKFYLWSIAEITDVLGPADAPSFCQCYGVRREGNFEGRNILNRLDTATPEPDAPTAARLAAMRAKLLARRSTRIPPARDDKILADWNGLMIAALANASTPLMAPHFAEIAARAFAFVSAHMSRTDRLGHSYRNATLSYPGLASDFAAMIKAALALFELGGERRYLEAALAWQQALDRHYADRGSGGYFMTADDSESLVVRPKPTADEATPNANALAAQNLLRLSALTGEPHWREAAEALITALSKEARGNLFMHCALLNAVDLELRGADIVITGAQGAAGLLSAALNLPFLDRSVLRLRASDALPANHPHYPKLAAVPPPAAFVCVGQTCSLPLSDPAALAPAILALRSRTGVAAEPA